MNVFTVLLVAGGLTIAGAFVLDRLIALAIWLSAPILPNDLAGPNGWFMDTQNGNGVFDRVRLF